MKSIFEYRDYHLYLQDYYDERKRLGSFSWREFCRKAGFSSPNFLKLVCMGQSKLSKIKACQVAKSMGLVDYEEQYFYQLVAFGNAETNEAQRAALLEMQRIASRTKLPVHSQASLPAVTLQLPSQLATSQTLALQAIVA